MRELERDSDNDDSVRPQVRGLTESAQARASAQARRVTGGTASPRTLAVVGRGRLGTALATALRAMPATGTLEVSGPHGRGYDGADADAILLCIPDREIVAAAALIAPGKLVGHCSGASGPELLAPHEAFSFHPLMTVIPARDDFTGFSGAGAAIAGVTPRALDFAGSLAHALGMRPIRVADADRAAYHAAASIASNFLVTLEAAAERLAASSGVDRRLLAPLVRATVENWVEAGGETALTGPVARGDEETVASQRQAVAERASELLPLFDALVDATRVLAGRLPARDSEDGSRIKIARTITEVRAAVREARRRGQGVALVPTMGAFHEGHLSLMRHARRQCGFVVVSLFVNPTQFNDPSDLSAYPREERRDAALAEAEGVDLLFIPSAAAMYPEGFATRVAVNSVSDTLEGVHRGLQHFEGVATVVIKLLNIVAPDRAYVGQKDAQQAAVIKRLVQDVNLPVAIEVCPTVRAADGLAHSSRNVHLAPADRARAAALHRALRAAEEAICSGEHNPSAVAALARQELNASGIEPEYFELVEPETFEPVKQLGNRVLALVAATVGGTRLIDNHLIHVPAGATADARTHHSAAAAPRRNGAGAKAPTTNVASGDVLARPAA